LISGIITQMATMKNALQSLLDLPASEQESRGYINTAAEIARQPFVWRKTLDVIRSGFPAVAAFCAESRRLLLTGAGSSYYAALSAVPFLRQSYRCVEAIPSTEILMDPDSSFPREEFILVSLARSGNSPEGNAVFELAEKLRPGLVKQLVITCNRNGELARLVDALPSRGLKLLLPEESNDKSLAMTASFTSLTIASYALGFLKSRGAYREAVEGLAQGAETLLAGGSDLARDLAGEGYGRVFFLGSRPFLGGAMEAQLKVQELSGGAVIAKAEDCLGFRHGFMAAVDANSLIVLVLSQDPCRQPYEMDLLAEIRQKGLGRKTVAMTGGRNGPDRQKIGALTDALFDYGPVHSVSDQVLAPLAALTGQLLGVFLSLHAGLRPDNPSPSGVINRVVQGVRIHPCGVCP
jgi:tagatose-6-phosphate ketose/aldose isomerase